MTENNRLGQFISEKRMQNSMTKQELAGLIGISTAYLSQIESGIRCNPKEDIIANLISCLHLTTEGIYKLYDLYAAANSTIAIDVTQYIKLNGIVSKAIRIAEKCGAKECDWLEFIENLNK